MKGKFYFLVAVTIFMAATGLAFWTHEEANKEAARIFAGFCIFGALMYAGFAYGECKKLRTA